MNATELFLADGRSAGIFFCAECRNVKRTETEAAECCAPDKCSYCGTEIPRKNYRTACPDCIEAKEREKEAARFAAAEKVEQWDNEWIFSEGHGNGGGFFSELDGLREWIEEEADEGTEMPGYVWTCEKIPFASVSIQEITERIADSVDAYEDFDVDDLYGLNELEAALEAFNRANESVMSYRCNYKRALLVNKSNADVDALAASECGRF